MININEVNNDLSVCVDWIAFTVFAMDSSDDVIRFLGFSPDSFSLMDSGANGYKCRKQLSGYPMSVLYNGSGNMGIHVSITGSAVSQALNAYCKSKFSDSPFTDDITNPFEGNYLTSYLKDILSIGHFTRLDLAIDDIGVNYYSIPSIVEILSNRLMVTKFRKWTNRCENYMTGESEGHTVYLGVRKSDVFLRIYDKSLEQKVSLPWVRWEFEIKNRYADSMARKIIALESIALVTFGLLTNYCRVIESDNSNRTRCSTDSKWLSFMDNVQRISLYTPPEEKDIDKSKEWLRKGTFSTLAGVCSVEPDFLHEFIDNFDFYLNRMSPAMCDRVQRALNK